MIPGLDPDVARGIALIHRLLVLEVARMREAGASLAQIAAALDCSVTTAKRWADREVAA